MIINSRRSLISLLCQLRRVLPRFRQRGIVLLSASHLLVASVAGTWAAEPFGDAEQVGARSSDRVVVPVNQVLTPAGIQVDLPDMRPQVVALSPDGRLLATSGKTHELVIVDPAKGTILQRVVLPAEPGTNAEPDTVSTHILKPDKEGQVSFTGLVFSPDSSRLYLSNVNGSIKVFSVGSDGKVEPLTSIPLPEANAPARKKEIPAGLAISRDGKRLFVAGNLSNRLLELDLETRQLVRTFDVGVAPYGVVLAGRKAYVSNWGGRRPDANSVTGPAGRGMLVRVDPVRYIANEGSVSVIDLDAGRVLSEVLVGLHSSGLAITPDRRHVVVANAGSDSLCVIDTRTDKVVDIISLRWHPNDFFGASPNALAFDPSGKTLYVCNGTQNAIAVLAFKPRKSKLLGLIPTGWFPGDIAFDAKRKALHVANIKGLGSWKRYAPGQTNHFNSHQYYGSLSLVPLPDKTQLARHTQTVLKNYRRSVLELAKLPPRPNQPPRPVPEGDGDPSLCVFGEEVTPNQHKMVREFVLLDNTYCSGILSADGHQWADTAFATDYMEKSFAGFPRSYPDGMDDDDIDALAYAPSGFIWDNALAHGKTLRDYGEFAITEASWKDKSKKGKPKFLDYYRDFVSQTGLIHIWSRPAIESLRPHLCTNTVGWDMAIPDVFRAAQFIKELREYEKKGEFPNLAIICLPNDHTSGTKAGTPTPAAQVADNDLAFGQIVEAISRSRFWKETCILTIEDDPQAGWDHVSGYRTTAYVVSPYTKRRAVVHTNYNQTSLLRTIELILGLPPMNQMDASATPMFDCFTDKPDFTPFAAVPNKVPLDQMNPEPKAIHDPVQRRYALASARLPLDKIDQCPEDLFNRILWHAQKGSKTPYPTWAITVQGGDDDD